MRLFALLPVLAFVALACTSAFGARAETPPPPNSKISVEENTKGVESAKLFPYNDLHSRRGDYASANEGYRAAIDARRERHIAPMLEARTGLDGMTGRESASLSAASAEVTSAGGDPAPVAGLTESAIRSFYAESESAHRKPFGDYAAWMKKHTHEAAKITQTTTVKMPGASPVIDSRTMTRPEIFDTLREGYDALRDATVRMQISEIVMNPDGRSARVKDRTVITGMTVPVEKDKDLRGDGTSLCDSEVVLTPGAGIQVRESSCTIDLSLSPSQEL